jgi:hypothetical protein
MLTTELAKEDPDFDMLKLIVDRYNNNHRWENMTISP